MKEITRRLYTKPVMLGMALVVGIALVVALFVTAKSTAATNTFPVNAGPDEFNTAADGTTFHDFGGSPIPAGFFGQYSQAFNQLVALEGVPLSPDSDADTIIERQSTVQAPGGSTTIAMTALSLKSSAPITVTFNDGVTTWTESWDMQVGLSQFKSSTGTMTINSNSFDSTLKVWPRFTFTRNGVTKVLDTGSGGSGLAAASSDEPGLSPQAVSNGFAVQPAPEPIATVAPCQAVAVNDFDSRTTVSAAASSCPPITLSSVNSPWGPCAPNTFCVTVPITEEERWARHRPRPKTIAVKGGAIAE